MNSTYGKPCLFDLMLFGHMRIDVLQLLPSSGFCGALHGYLPCIPIAASVTAQGRNMIAQTKEIVERDFGGDVVYGDTVSMA